MASLRETLEKALVENPDDLAAHAAYADLLSEEGDPRGELIRVQLSLEDDKLSAEQREGLGRRDAELLKEHGRQWLGGLADYLLDHPGASQFGFARGWLDYLELQELTDEFAEALAQAPAARLLRHLFIHDAEEYEVHLDPLIQSPYLSNLRAFQFGTDPDRHVVLCENVVDFLARLPHLEQLSLSINGVDTERLFGLRTLTRLRSLEVNCLTAYPLEILAANPSLGRLTRLSFHPHALIPDDEEAYITPAGVRAVLRSPHLQSLTHLHLHLTDLGSGIGPEIVQSGILKRLKVLDLRNGTLTDQDALALAAFPDLRNLELLDVSVNRLTEQGIHALMWTGIKIQAEGQQGEGQHPHNYLTDGDWE
jgi:uncharacterized protein (TIGR02996 family)